ncbi:MAG: hypothetical protein AAF513_03715 [Pseudomonadota bacterium]
MDPITQIISALRAATPDGLHGGLETAEAGLRTRLAGLLAGFEWVPKHEYAAHIELLKTLQAQVDELESRLNELEGDTRK